MNRDSDFRPEDDSPLANSSFFRSIEESDAKSSSSVDDEQTDWDDEDQEVGEDFEETDLEAVFDEDDEEIDSSMTDEDAAQTSGSTGTVATVLGWTVGGAGLALTVLSMVSPGSTEAITTALAKAQVHPIHLLMVGVVLGVYGSLRRELARRATNGREDFSQLDLAIERMEAAANEQRERREDEELSDAERLLLTLERQDGKINNLTRATKLYGKPLVEISKQVSELAAQIQDIDSLDDQVDKLQKDLSDDLSLHWDETRKKIEEGFASHHHGVDDSFEQQNARLAELSKVVEGQGRPMAEFSNQMTGINDRLEGLSQAVTDRLQGLNQAVTELQGTVTDLRGTVEGAKSETTDLTPLDARMTELHTQMQRLSQQVEALASRPVPTAAAPTTPQSAATQPAPKAPAPAATSTPSAAPPDNSGLAQSIAGKREAKGANVLGAIAKLKSMRG